MPKLELSEIHVNTLPHNGSAAAIKAAGGKRSLTTAATTTAATTTAAYATNENYDTMAVYISPPRNTTAALAAAQRQQQQKQQQPSAHYVMSYTRTQQQQQQATTTGLRVRVGNASHTMPHYTAKAALAQHVYSSNNKDDRTAAAATHVYYGDDSDVNVNNRDDSSHDERNNSGDMYYGNNATTTTQGQQQQQQQQPSSCDVADDDATAAAAMTTTWPYAECMCAACTNYRAYYYYYNNATIAPTHTECSYCVNNNNNTAAVCSDVAAVPAQYASPWPRTSCNNNNNSSTVAGGCRCHHCCCAACQEAAAVLPPPPSSSSAAAAAASPYAYMYGGSDGHGGVRSRVYCGGGAAAAATAAVVPPACPYCHACMPVMTTAAPSSPAAAHMLHRHPQPCREAMTRTAPHYADAEAMMLYDDGDKDNSSGSANTTMMMMCGGSGSGGLYAPCVRPVLRSVGAVPVMSIKVNNNNNGSKKSSSNSNDDTSSDVAVAYTSSSSLSQPPSSAAAAASRRYANGGGNGAAAASAAAAAAAVHPDTLRGRIVELACTATGKAQLQATLRTHTTAALAVCVPELCAQMDVVALDVNACHVVRVVVDRSDAAQLQQLLDALCDETLLLNLCTVSQYTRRIVQSLFERQPLVDLHEVLAVLARHAAYLAATQQGCISLMRVYELCEAAQKATLIASLLPTFAHLALDPLGNYVVQCAMEHSSTTVAAQLAVSCFAGHLLAMSCSKFASNVVEKVIRCCGAVPAVRRMLLDELVYNPAALQEVVSDNYGNYALQSLIMALTQPTELKRVCDRVRPLLASTPYASRIDGKLKQKQRELGCCGCTTTTTTTSAGGAEAQPRSQQQRTRARHEASNAVKSTCM